MKKKYCYEIKIFIFSRGYWGGGGFVVTMAAPFYYILALYF
jgi:hypothetical protein